MTIDETTDSPRKKIRIGDLLVQHKIISEAQLMTALSEQKKLGRKLGRTLIELNYVEEEKLLGFLSQQLKLPLLKLANYQFKAEVSHALPEMFARRFRAIILESTPMGYLVAMGDPTDIFTYDELIKILKKPLSLAVASEADVMQAIDRIYRKTGEINSFAEELGDELQQNDFDIANLAPADDLTDAPVVKLIKSIFEDAIHMKASDIHIEPDEKTLRIRQRIDGVLQEQIVKEKRIAPALVLRLKLLAGLDISEKRLPQDGRFNVRIKDKSIDVRMSTMPIQYGESVVMRLLDQSGGLLSFDKLGMPDAIRERMLKLISYPHGMILVTGPTGSGKTTTLYAALNALNTPMTKIITVEDPVEYRLPRINQVQVHEKIGLTFASVLRTALRQDPDVVLIGEMRDAETAQIGLRAAMTGHLVLSTLHTNDAIHTPSRLLDMGAQGFLLAATLRAIIAQRLIRRNCSECTQDVPASANELAWLKNVIGNGAELKTYKKGKGCISCNQTGYSGRVGIYELLEVNEPMAEALRNQDVQGFVQASLANPTFHSLTQSAFDYAAQGITSLEEVMRISGDIDLS